MLRRIPIYDTTRTLEELRKFPGIDIEDDIDEDDDWPLVWDERGTLRWEEDALLRKFMRTGMLNPLTMFEGLSIREECHLRKRMGFSLSAYYNADCVQVLLEEKEKENEQLRLH